MRRSLAILGATTFVLVSSLARAQDASVRPLAAPLVSRHGGAGSAPVVRMASGDLALAASGVLVTDADGTTRCFLPSASGAVSRAAELRRSSGAVCETASRSRQEAGDRRFAPDPEIVDVAATPDGSVVGLARSARPRSARQVRYAADGTAIGSRTYHRGALDTHTYADVTGAANGDVILCVTTAGRRTRAVIDRIAPDGAVRWSRPMEIGTECDVVASDALGDVYWAGSTNGGATTLVERLDAAGRSRWRTLFEGAPLPAELALSPAGVTIGGDFDGTVDLPPGAATQSVTTSGYRAFVTQLDPAGRAVWAW